MLPINVGNLVFHPSHSPKTRTCSYFIRSNRATTSSPQNPMGEDSYVQYCIDARQERISYQSDAKYKADLEDGIVYCSAYCAYIRVSAVFVQVLYLKCTWYLVPGTTAVVVSNTTVFNTTVLAYCTIMYSVLDKP